MVRCTRIIMILAALCGITGCAKTTWYVTLKPTDQGMRRTVTKAVSNQSGAPEMIASATITDKTPADLRGAGRVHTLHDPLGEVGLYIERFAGNDDLAGQLETIKTSADKLTKLVHGWFEHELGTEAHWPALEKFVTTQLHRDVYNLGLTFWAGRVAQDDGQNTLAHLGLYLIERGYLEPGEFPRIVALFNPSPMNQHAAESGMRNIQRVIARRMGIVDGQPLPDALTFLSTPDRAADSFKSWYRATDMYKRQLANWKAENPDKPDDEMPFELSEEAIGPLGDVVGLEIFGSSEDVELSMNDAPAPVWTNGQYDAEKSQLTWSHRIDQELAPPAVFYLVWTRPNAEAQKKHFGRVVLDDRSLMEYAVWRAGLDDDLRTQWDDFVESLAPGDGLVDKLESFRFQRDGGTLVDESTEGAGLLVHGLNTEK